MKYAGIAIGVVVVVAVLAIVIYFLLKKNNVGKKKDFVEFDGNNTELLKVKSLSEKECKGRSLSAIVPPTHDALIIRNGAIVNQCSGGEFPLTENGVTIRTLKIMYVSKTVRVTINWGTQEKQRIPYRDPKIGKIVSVGAYGEAEVKVSDPSKFYLNLVSNFGDTFSIDNLQERIRTLVVDETVKAIGKVINEKKLSYVDFEPAKFDIQKEVGDYLSVKFTNTFGFEVFDFIIKNMNLAQEEEEEIKRIYAEDSDYERGKVIYEREQEFEERERQSERRRKEAIRDDKELDDFLYNRERDRERDDIEYERKNRHEDQDRLWAREDKERDYKERIENKHMDTVKDIEISRSEAEKVKNQNGGENGKSSLGNAGHHCSVCGASYKPGAKYCPSCGMTLPSEEISSKCPDCGSEVPWGTAYCPRCGHKFGK